MVPNAVAKRTHLAVGEVAGGEANETKTAPARSGRLRPRQRRQRDTAAEGVHVTVPVAFNNDLALGDAAFLLAEVRRAMVHVLLYFYHTCICAMLRFR